MNTQRLPTSFPRLLIVHGGPAHRDDLLTACVLLARNPQLSVERRDPSAAELADPSVIVADVGGRFEPELNNYDHHQIQRGADPCCALTLVLRSMSLEPSAREIWPWLAFTELLDSRGPTAASRALGISAAALAATFSPVERVILRDFAKVSRLAPDMPQHSRLREIGEVMLRELERTTARLELLERKAVRLQVSRLDALDLRAVGEDPMMASELFCKRSAPETAIFITRNQRGPGWALWRRNDHPTVDFARLRDDPRVSFVHSTGFMAVVEAGADPVAVAAEAVATPT